MRETAKAPLRRGEVVVFRHPGDPERGVVKRVVGVAGDLVRVRRGGGAEGGVMGGVLGLGVGGGILGGGGGGWLGGEREREREREKLVEVPQGHLWVEGDEGFHSRDSNHYGPVSCLLSCCLCLSAFFPGLCTC